MHARFGLACTLRPFSIFACSLKIAPSSFSFLVTKPSDPSFYEKQAVHARFGLACTHARSKYFQTLRATLELVHLHFLFWWPSSQITPSMRQSCKKLHAAHAERADIFSELRTCWLRNHALLSRLQICVVILVYFEGNIEEWGFKSSFQGRNEAQMLDLRL